MCPFYVPIHKKRKRKRERDIMSVFGFGADWINTDTALSFVPMIGLSLSYSTVSTFSGKKGDIGSQSN